MMMKPQQVNGIRPMITMTASHQVIDSIRILTDNIETRRLTNLSLCCRTAKKRSRALEEEDCDKTTASAAASQKHYAIASDASLPTRKASSSSGIGTIDFNNISNNNIVNNQITTATMAQQQQHEQIRELLMQQSALRTANSTQSQQQRNLELLSSVQQQEHQQRLMLSTLSSRNDRNDDLQRLLILDRLGRAEPIRSQYSDQDLRLLLLQRQNFGGNLNIADNVVQSLASSPSLSEQYQQQQMNLLSASANMHQRRSTMNNNDLLLQEMLMAQSRSNDARNLYAAAASIHDNVGSRFSTNTLPMRTSQGLATTGSGRARTDPSFSFNVAKASAPMPVTAPNLRAAAAARLLSPRNKDAMSTQKKTELKVDDEVTGNYQSKLSEMALLQQQLQDSNPMADRNREAAMAEILDARARYAMGEALDRTSTMNIPTSAIQQLQRLHREQQLAAAQEEAFRSAALQSLLASNNHPNSLSAHTTDRTTIPNTNITTIPMDCESDQQQLSKYQVLIRRQLEYFVSQEDDVAYSVQGRKKQIVIGQVGIRCRHCSYLPHRLRGRGAGYYPAKLSGVYQAAQNMATNHLNQHCNVIPAAIREELCSLRGGRHESSAGGGKQYWTNKCTEIGLMEHDDGVYFKGSKITTGNMKSEDDTSTK
jgi:hypothetical protein